VGNMAGNCLMAIPGRIQPICKIGDDRKGLGIGVHQGKFGMIEHLTAQKRDQGALTKGRAAGTKTYDFGHAATVRPSCFMMLAAALRPAPMALMTVAPPVTISPPA